ncbi:MAG TPA: ATP-dependent Clp protease ATP-binding subunit [Polyangiales bacterium]|nr:ATP-dependent Clp protease ATP-binding subunit [Polyangiales bacterium]
MAQKKRQPLSTAHLLIALFQCHREIAELCNGNGFSEQSLLTALNAAPEEPASGVDIAVERAQKLAATSGADAPSALHVLLSLVRELRSAASQGLISAGLSPEKLANAAREALHALKEPPVEAALPPDPQKARQKDTRERWDRGRGPRLDRFRSFALAKETESKLARTRVEQTEPIQARVAEPLREAGSESRPRPAKAQPEQLALSPQPRPTAKPRGRAARSRHKTPAPEIEVTWTLDEQRFPLLCAIARNLTQLAASGEIDPVIGRDADIERLLDVLARRRGNNPLLVGAPGVGKTAVVEGLALALVKQARRGQAHTKGEPFILLEVAASSLLAGTGVRGALSERIQTLRKEVADSGRVLLFIDEIHGVLGGIEGDGLGSELKTALARGELPVIGATTDVEYRRIFERDAALARRFTRIEVSEPSRADTLRILEGIAPQYSAHHAVKYKPDALEAAVDLSVRYMPLRQLPDKAIGLLDQAAARVRRSGETSVDRVAVARVVSELVQVPVERLLMEDRQALLRLEEQLSARVVGQVRAIDAISHALRRSAAGFRGERPLGTFLFAGPTGVGKTEMAKAIAEVLFPGIPMTRLDMSELGQSHAVARLLGAPPGYIGHEDGGQLTEAVRHRPYQLVLLDEIEKAHMQVLLALLPLLDEGRLTDGRGRTVDFTNTVIVMTSNLGVETNSKGRIGFGDARLTAGDYAAGVLARVRAALPPELWNRIDEPLCFLPLVESELSEIARRMLRAVGELAHARHGVSLDIDESAVALLLRSGGFDPALGARPMRRTVSRLVEAPLAQALLAAEFKAGDRIRIAAAQDVIEFSRASSK